MLNRVNQQPSRSAYPTWNSCCHVDCSVPVPTAQCFKIVVPVSAQLLDFRVSICVRLPAIEQRQLVPSCLGGVNQMPPDKLCSAENQNFHKGLLVSTCSFRVYNVLCS